MRKCYQTDISLLIFVFENIIGRVGEIFGQKLRQQKTSAKSRKSYQATIRKQITR